MQPVLPLDQMTTEEKLRAIEEIWDDLLRRPGGVPSPAWEAGVLPEKPVRSRHSILSPISLEKHPTIV